MAGIICVQMSSKMDIETMFYQAILKQNVQVYGKLMDYC